MGRDGQLPYFLDKCHGFTSRHLKRSYLKKTLRILSFWWKKLFITIKSLNSVWSGQHNFWFQFINSPGTSGNVVMPLDLIKCENQSAQQSQSFGLPENDCSLLCLHIQREAGGNFIAFTGLHSWANLWASPLSEMFPLAWQHDSIAHHSDLPKNVHFAVLKFLISRKEHYCSRAHLSHTWVLEKFTTGGVKGAALREIKTCSSLFNKCQSMARSKNHENWHEENYEWTGIKWILSK